MELGKYLDMINGEYAEKFSIFKRVLIDYNNSFNLTSVTDDKGVLYKHFLDSIAGESLFKEGAKVLDVGSGGGFPAVPLKIVRDDLDVTMLEATGKKCTYLNAVVDKLGLNCVQVINGRAETAARTLKMREKFDAVSARAVARLNILSEYCLPFVAVGGTFIAYKGDAAEEISEAEHAVKILGGEIDKVINYELPENSGKRTLIVIKKVSATPFKYPRGNGKERKQPL